MITPRVQSLKGARADFEELENVSDRVMMHLADGLHAGVSYYRSPEGQEVVLVTSGGDVVAAQVPEITAALELTPTVHLVFLASEYGPGFEEALDAALGGGAMVSLIEHAPQPAEVQAVPRPDPAPPVSISLTVSEADFNYLTSNSHPFQQEFVERLETYAPGKNTAKDNVDTHWTVVYVVDRDHGYANVMLATAFIKAQGFDFELANDPDGEWWILTDFKDAGWRRHDEQQKVQQRLAREAAEASGDDLAQQFHMDSAKKEGEDKRNG